MAKWTEKKDDAADRRAGIKQGSARDKALDKARGLPPDVVKKGAGAGHDANKRNPLGAGADLSMAQRKKLPSSSFALPGKGLGPSGKGSGSYPIPDRSHAQNALARVSQHGSPAEKKAVRAKVRAKFGMGGK